MIRRRPASGSRSAPALLLSLLLAAFLPAEGRALQKEDPLERAATRAAHAGDRCLACGGGMPASGLEYQVRGQWVPLCGPACRGELRAHPDSILASVQPRAALFDEHVDKPRAISWGWFAFGLYVLAGLLCGAWCGHAAYSRGRDPRVWFALGFLFDVVAVCALSLAPGEDRPVPRGMAKIPATATPARCSRCGATIHPAAERCLACGAALAPRLEAEVRRAMAARDASATANQHTK